MLAVDVALSLPESCAGVAAFSSFPIVVEQWASKCKARADGLKVFQSHGRSDQLLPFASSGWLKDLLQAGGCEVQFVAHHGGHDLGGPEVLAAFGKFVQGLVC